MRVIWRVLIISNSILCRLKCFVNRVKWLMIRTDTKEVKDDKHNDFPDIQTMSINMLVITRRGAIIMVVLYPFC